MKKNLLPNMQSICLSDRRGEEFNVQVEVRKCADGKYYVFLSDTHQLGGSRIAQDAMHCFAEIRQRLNLKSRETIFFRHIYQENMGSTFGRFNVNWDSAKPTTYSFQMLSNIDGLQRVKNLLRDTEVIYGNAIDNSISEVIEKATAATA